MKLIKLERAPKPVELTEEKVEELTEKFKNEGSSVWNVNFIKMPLLGSSHRKCSYCEARLDEESKYMEVEHFRDKKDFPDSVVLWPNLLPSCKRCNGQKGSHNIETDGMIVNPYEDYPRNHFYIKNFRIRHLDEIGKRTIDVVYLNESVRMVQVRFQIGEEISKALETIKERVENFLSGQNGIAQRNKILGGVRNLLLECQPDAQYSAVSSTILLSDPDYTWVRAQLREFGLWDEFEELENVATSLCLPEWDGGVQS